MSIELSYRFSNFNTGGDAGRGIAKISFDACPIYMTNAQMTAIFLPTAPSTFHILKRSLCFSQYGQRFQWDLPSWIE